MGAGGSIRIGEGEETSSRTPVEEEEEEEEEVPLPPPSAWSGDMAPSLLDSSSYCTYRLGCLRGSPSLVLLNINCPSVDGNIPSAHTALSTHLSNPLLPNNYRGQHEPITHLYLFSTRHSPTPTQYLSHAEHIRTSLPSHNNLMKNTRWPYWLCISLSLLRSSENSIIPELIVISGQLLIQVNLSAVSSSAMCQLITKLHPFP